MRVEDREMTKTRKIAKNDVRSCVCHFFVVPLQSKIYVGGDMSLL